MAKSIACSKDVFSACSIDGMGVEGLIGRDVRGVVRGEVEGAEYDMASWASDTDCIEEEIE
ncbi:MAG: hypothetical protein NVSMB49_26190 [Ktedonobacteraceae bacterium]